MRGIWTFVEVQDGAIEDVSLEVLGKASELAREKGVESSAVIAGWQLSNIVEETAKYPVDKIYYVEHELLRQYSPSAYAKALHQLVERHKPEIMLFGATYNGADIAARLAVKTGAGLIAHVVGLEIERETGMLIGHVPGFGGSIVAVCRCRPNVLQMATVRPGVLEKPQPAGGNAEIIKFSPELNEQDVGLRLVERSVSPTIDITRAERVVVAGMGTGGDLTPLKQLAEKIGAELAVTRPLADMGAAPRDVQIGSTGYSLRSKLAIIAGASGAAHFVSGIRDVKTVIAINTDPNAPIFEFADYYVVGDLFKIIPRLTQALAR